MASESLAEVNIFWLPLVPCLHCSFSRESSLWERCLIAGIEQGSMIIPFLQNQHCLAGSSSSYDFGYEVGVDMNYCNCSNFNAAE